MNKTVKISLARTAFIIDEQAYFELDNYLKAIENQFKDSNSGKEIIEEIEQRIAEIFSEKCGEDKVVTLTIVREVISTLGTASEIQGEENKEEKTNNKKTSKKLFRDKQQAKLGGVFSGIAAYFNFDVSVIRILAVVCCVAILCIPDNGFAFFCVLIMAYISLWVVIPEAKTLQDRYQMRGESFTIDGITQKIKEGAEAVGSSTKEFAKQNSNFFYVLFRAICIVIGFSFLLAGATSLISLLLCIIGVFPLPAAILSALSGVFGIGSSLVACISCACIIGIPLVALVYVGILLTFNMRSPKWKPGLCLFLLWFIAIVVFGITCAGKAISYGNAKEINQTVTCPLPNDGVVKIVMENADTDYDYVFWDGDPYEYHLGIVEDKTILVYPRIHIRRSDAIDKVCVDYDKLVINRKSENRNLDFVKVEDGIIYINANILNKHKSLYEIGTDIDITIPEDFSIELNGPETFDFEGYSEYNNIVPFRKLSYYF